MSSGYQQDTLISSFMQKKKKKQDERREGLDKVWSRAVSWGQDRMGEEFQTDVGSVEE